MSVASEVEGPGLTECWGEGVEKFLGLYRCMFAARCIDQAESELATRGEAFFHVSGAGHEGAAVLHLHLSQEDWLHLHYRDKALMLARGVSPAMFLHSVLCTADSHSAGRQMSAHMSDPALRLLSLAGPVGNHALQAVGVAAAIKDQPARPLVVCSMGDGTSQEGEVLEAIAEAVRSDLPVLFWIEDNKYSISTSTCSKTFFSHPGESVPKTFYGLPIHRLDGRDVLGCHQLLGPIVESIRASRGPALVVFEVARLSDHTHADDETIYRPATEIASGWKRADPLFILGLHLLAGDVSPEMLENLEADVRAEVRGATEAALAAPLPEPALDAKKPLPGRFHAEAEYRGVAAEPRLTMLEAIRGVLRHHLATDARVTLYGEDLEDPKGDVFGVTRGLSSSFPGRVVNSALSESTIVGVSIGRALAGGRPVAFIQFADFLPLALNQIMSELGAMYWRTNGGWQCPVIVMVACGAYRPGLGPFHAQTMEAVLAHVPGVDVVMPSSAGDAAGLLHAAFASGRPTVFFYPKVSLNDRERATSGDVDRHWVPLGKAHFLAQGDDLTIVTWGSTVLLAEKTAAALATAGVRTDLVDLRSLSPWDREAVCASVRRTGKLLVVHEDNVTAGFGAEVVAWVAEALRVPFRTRRVARPDTYVPCNFANQLAVLPSFKSILTAAAEMLDLDLTWEMPAALAENLFLVEAEGSSPADQAVTVLEWLIVPGASIRAGDHIADLEADKAVYPMMAPADGLVERIMVEQGETVGVGTPMLYLRTSEGKVRKRLTREEAGTPHLRRRGAAADESLLPGKSVAELARVRASAEPSPKSGDFGYGRVPVTLSAVCAVEGRARLTNAELIRRFPDRTADEILRLTGIESRPLLGPDETALTIAVDAARQALAAAKLTIDDLDAVICSTGTPLCMTPSMACLILDALSGEKAREAPAHDVNAACTGYLYALAAGYDFIQAHPDARVLVVTAEAMSRVVNPADFNTAILFGDAASATILGALPVRKFRDLSEPLPPLSPVLRGEGSGVRGNEPLQKPRVFGKASAPLTPTLSPPSTGGEGVVRETLGLETALGATDRRGARLILRQRPLLSAKGDRNQALRVATPKDGHVVMEGRQVFAEAVRQMTSILHRACVGAGLRLQDLAWIVPHQANGRILAAVRDRLGLGADRLFSNIRDHGNTSSSTIPLCLAELAGQVKPGDKIGLCAFGGGFTFGSAILERQDGEP